MFYSVFDCLHFLTLYYVTAKKRRVKTSCLTIMPNHVHSLNRADRDEDITDFIRDLCSMYAMSFNKRYKRKGRLFLKSALVAAKTKVKTIRSAINYIVNNPVEGSLCKNVLDYRWNFLKYQTSKNPFSEKLVLSKASTKMRMAVDTVKSFHKSIKPLEYSTLSIIFKGLSRTESDQLIDLIISLYNPTDISDYEKYFGSLDNAIKDITMEMASEYDIQDERDDFSVYTKMAKCSISKGFRLGEFGLLDERTLNMLASMLKAETSATYSQIRKFLHIKCMK